MGFDLLYLAILLLGAPFWLWKLLADPRWRDGIFERLSRYGELPRARRVWIRAASVGEVRAAARLARALSAGDPSLAFAVSTQTSTGAAEARRLLPAAEIRRAPLDLSWVADAALERLRPSAIVLIEGEIWPNAVRRAAARGVPVVVASGSISDRSFGRMKRFLPLLAPTFRRLSRVLAQTEEDAARFRELGTAPERLRVAGNLKSDPGLAAGEGCGEIVERLRAWKASRFLLGAGSTHAGEEEHALDALAAISRDGVDGCLLLAPRHPERFAEVARLLESRGVPFLRRTASGGGDAPARVFLLDTIGELAAAWGACDAAFVGGSLAPVGGHNLLEPAAAGIPVLWGPHVAQFRALAAEIAEAGAGREVKDAADLAGAVSAWARDAASRREAGAKGRALVDARRGISASMAREILALLPNAS